MVAPPPGQSVAGPAYSNPAPQAVNQPSMQQQQQQQAYMQQSMQQVGTSSVRAPPPVIMTTRRQHNRWPLRVVLYIVLLLFLPLSGTPYVSLEMFCGLDVAG